jgi:hypothetical protein
MLIIPVTGWLQEAESKPNHCSSLVSKNSTENWKGHVDKIVPKLSS